MMWGILEFIVTNKYSVPILVGMLITFMVNLLRSRLTDRKKKQELIEFKEMMAKDLIIEEEKLRKKIREKISQLRGTKSEKGDFKLDPKYEDTEAIFEAEFVNGEWRPKAEFVNGEWRVKDGEKIGPELSQAAQKIRIMKDSLERFEPHSTRVNPGFKILANNSSLFKSAFLKKIDTIINYQLYKVFFLKKTDSKGSVDSSLALTELVVKHQAKGNTLTYIYFLSAIIIHNVLIKLGIIEVNQTFEVVTAILITAVFLKQKILQYRLKKGLYGTTESEIRELLKFILDEKNKHHFTGEGGQRAIFNTPEEAAEFKESLEQYGLWGRQS